MLSAQKHVCTMVQVALERRGRGEHLLGRTAASERGSRSA
jgi:hypothetical protein